MRDTTGARVIFPTAEDKDQDLITIIGKEDAVREAQKELEALIQNLVRPGLPGATWAAGVGTSPWSLTPSLGCVPQDNVVEDYMLVDPKHHRHFVIRRGQVLREIAEEYGGVMVSFPRSGTQSDKVTLKGAKECVEAARKRIQEIIEDLVGTWSSWGTAPCVSLRLLPLRSSLAVRFPKELCVQGTNCLLCCKGREGDRRECQ